MLKEQIKSLAKQIFPEVVDNRRHLHAHPELSFEEFETSIFIQKKLDELGIPWEILANTGVVGLLKGDLPSTKTIALRADMDALPIFEVPGRVYGSQNEGKMHACGHDVHSSSLLGVAKILTELKGSFGGTIKFIFQPGEEKLPGGASLMIKEGVLQNPKPEAVLGQHVMPLIDVGKVGFRSGKYMASSDEIYVRVKGQGGHGAQPQQTIDPIVIAAHIITALQQIVSRIADPKIPSVLSFGKIIAEGATNIIPDEVYLEGTFRTFDEVWREKAHHKMKKIAIGIAEGMDATCEFEVRKGYPFLVNDESLTAQVRGFAEGYLGEDNIEDLDLWLAAEDFAFYSQQAPACFYRLGTRNVKKGITSAVHTSTFDVDEDALVVSTGLMAYLAVKQLGN